MVNQVMVVAILMIVQGALTVLASLYLVANAVILAVVATTDPQLNRPGGPPAGLFYGISAGYGVLALLMLASAVLNVWGGIRGLSFRSRGLVLAGVFSNAIMFCNPIALTVLIYGAIVMMNADVVRAFRLAEEGMTAAQIKARFSPTRRMTGLDDDDDDDFDRR